MQTMYDGINGSPSNKLLNLISSSATSIVLDSTSNLPAAPNIATIGDSSTAEVILYTGKTGSTLSGCTRGFGGTTARSWAANTPVYRAFTKYDYDAIKLNINTIGDAASTNLLINGGFDIWQRGTSFSSGYTADRWRIDFNGSGATRTITRQAFTGGQTDVHGNPMYYLRFSQSVAGSGGTFNVIQQRVENVLLLSGKTVTLSFYAMATSPINIFTYASQGFGSGGSADTGVLGDTVEIGSTWSKYTQTFVIPSVFGKTIGVGNYTYFGFFMPNNTTFTINIANVQLNYGSVALPFVPRSYADELRLCQRYYIPLIINTLAAIYFTGYVRISSASFPVMRIVPTATLGTVSFVGNDGTPGTLYDAGVTNGTISLVYNWTGGTVGKTFIASMSLSLDAEL